MKAAPCGFRHEGVPAGSAVELGEVVLRGGGKKRLELGEGDGEQVGVADRDHVRESGQGEGGGGGVVEVGKADVEVLGDGFEAVTLLVEVGLAGQHIGGQVVADIGRQRGI